MTKWLYFVIMTTSSWWWKLICLNLPNIKGHYEKMFVFLLLILLSLNGVIFAKEKLVISTEEKKEEGKRWGWVGFSYSFPKSGLGEPNIYHDSGVIYKNEGILLGGCLTVKNYWGLLTGEWWGWWGRKD